MIRYDTVDERALKSWQDGQLNLAQSLILTHSSKKHEGPPTTLQTSTACKHQKIVPRRRRNVHVVIVQNQSLQALTPFPLFFLISRLQRQCQSVSPSPDWSLYAGSFIQKSAEDKATKNRKFHPRQKQSRAARPSTGAATWRARPHMTLSLILPRYVKKRRHPQNRKYITYRIAVRGRPSHCHRKVHEVWMCVFLKYASAQTDIQTHRHANRNTSHPRGRSNDGTRPNVMVAARRLKTGLSLLSFIWINANKMYCIVGTSRLWC